MTNHSELPWDVDATGYYIGKVYIGGVIEVAQILDMPYPSAGSRESNAAFIVRACNNHEKLVEALKKIIQLSKGCDRDSFIRNEQEAKYIAKQAIQSAEAE